MSRVVVVTTSYPRVGADADGHFVATEARELARAHEVIVVAPCAPRHPDPRVTVVDVPGGEAFGAPGLASRLREDPRRSLAALRFFSSLATRVRALEPDRVVVHWPVPTALMMGDVTAHLPTTLVSHGACVRVLSRIPPPLRVACVKRLLRGDTRWSFVSTSLRDELLAALPADTAASVSARSFVEAPPLELPPREELGPPWPRRAHVIVGRLVPSKRTRHAITYAAHTEHIRHTDIVIVGDGPERASLEVHARTLGIAAHFTGALPRREALGILAHSAGLLFASEAEGLSSVCREAAHYGVPILTVP